MTEETDGGGDFMSRGYYTPRNLSTSDYYSEALTPSPSEEIKCLRLSQNKYTRLVKKSGASNVKRKHAANHRKKISLHLRDLFTTLVELRWRWILLIVSLCHVISWFFFGILWWIVAFGHGDLHSSETKNPYNDPEPCTVGVHDFVTSFMFSMETQITTGYGTRVPSDVCPEAIFLIIVQNIFGAIIACLTLGLVFTKASRSKARQASILFSRKAVICLRDGKLRLLFRVADMRKSKIINSDVKACFVSAYRTFEGELINHYQRKLALSIDESDCDVCLVWPATICHTIDAVSPLFDMSALDILQREFEIIVRLTGTLETTGQLMETKTSYLSSEILWGHQFQPLLIKIPTWRYGYLTDYEKFEETKMIDTPVCSARQILQLSNLNSPSLCTKEPTYDTIFE